MRRILLFLFLFLLFSPAFSWAADTAEVAAGEGLNLWGMLRQGGWAMYPLALASLVMFFLIFYGYRETARKKFVPDAALPRLSELLWARDVAGAAHLLHAAPSVLSRSLEGALSRARPEMQDANKAAVEANLVESLEHEENLVGQWINYLNVVATVAPMIGLLGTVSGMIGAFQTISRGGMGRPELLAGDIGQALITTATGLVIGIPAMIAFFILRNRLDNVMLAVSQASSLLVDQLAGEVSGVDETEQAVSAVAAEAMPEPNAP